MRAAGICRRHFASLAVAGLTALAAAPAKAEAPAPTPAIRALPTPAEAAAVPLGGGASTPGAEQWESIGGETFVRNVAAPTLTPVLPDPAKATGAAVIVVPGGAFMMLSIENEGFAVARWLADHGVAAFVLKYRTQPTPRDPEAFMTALTSLMRGVAKYPEAPINTPPEAVADAQAAVRLVRARSQAWGVDPARVGLLGFSAGAMTTLSVALAEDRAARPDFIAPVYGPLTPRPVPADAPPMFLAVALDDPLMARGKSIGLIDSWRTAKRPVEAHLYEQGGHGFGMHATRPASRLWIDEFYAWMADLGLLKPKS